MKTRLVRIYRFEDIYKGWGDAGTIAFVEVPANLNFKKEWGKRSEVKAYLMKHCSSFNAMTDNWEVLSQKEIQRYISKYIEEKTHRGEWIRQLEKRRT